MTTVVLQKCDGNEAQRNFRNRKEALKVAEVAKMLGVSQQQIYEMAAAGTIPHFYVQGTIRFCAADLAEWIKKEIEQ